MRLRSVAGPYPARPGPPTPNIPTPRPAGPSLVPRLGGVGGARETGGYSRGAPGKRRAGGGAYPRGCGGGPARLTCTLPTRARTMGGARPPAETQLCFSLPRTTLRKQTPQLIPVSSTRRGRTPSSKDPDPSVPVEVTQPSRRHPGRFPRAFVTESR